MLAFIYAKPCSATLHPQAQRVCSTFPGLAKAFPFFETHSRQLLPKS
jgi:hypothetical protein